MAKISNPNLDPASDRLLRSFYDEQARNFRTGSELLTLAASATTFAVTSNVMVLTGDAGANTIATITGGLDGMLLTIIFVDTNITITDDGSHAADTIDLSAAFTSSDDTVLQLVRDSVSWYECSRSVN